MKKRYLVIGSLALAQFWARAQESISKPIEKVKQTDVELVFNYYTQDGKNSAITGGEGTEELTVYGPMAKVKHSFKNSELSYRLGSDIISSASTDKIDFIESSASKVDARTYANVSYNKSLPNNLNVYGGTGFSIESDYFSLGGTIGIEKRDNLKLKTFSAELKYFNDDLRWGRLNGSGFKADKLLYPAELRSQEWFNIHRRKSYNLKLGYSRILNSRNTFGIYPELTYQDGLLSTPFHRVFLTDGTVSVENLPKNRYKTAVALKLNSFANGFIILKNAINGYTDSYGISAGSFDHETSYKVKPLLVLIANFRIYHQNASTYFGKKNSHKAEQKYRTSDYDLSEFNTYKIGLGFKHYPSATIFKKINFKTVLFRYNFYHRNNGLSAHIISVSFKTSYKN